MKNNTKPASRFLLAAALILSPILSVIGRLRVAHAEKIRDSSEKRICLTDNNETI